MIDQVKSSHLKTQKWKCMRGEGENLSLFRYLKKSEKFYKMTKWHTFLCLLWQVVCSPGCFIDLLAMINSWRAHWGKEMMKDWNITCTLAVLRVKYMRNTAHEMVEQACRRGGAAGDNMFLIWDTFPHRYLHSWALTPLLHQTLVPHTLVSRSDGRNDWSIQLQSKNHFIIDIVIILEKNNTLY